MIMIDPSNGENISLGEFEELYGAPVLVYVDGLPWVPFDRSIRAYVLHLCDTKAAAEELVRCAISAGPDEAVVEYRVVPAIDLEVLARGITRMLQTPCLALAPIRLRK